MTEAAFPVLGAAFVVLVVLPAFSLLAKAVLVLLETHAAGGPLRSLRLRYVVITAASAVPLAWFFSAALHQVEPDSLVFACLLDHRTASLCLEPASFALLLASGVAIASFVTFRQNLIPEAAALSAVARTTRERLERIIDSDRSLAVLRGRLTVTEQAGFAVGTVGSLRPSVVIGVEFAGALTDPMLHAALCHESEHIQSLDPLRYLLLDLALRVNPFGAWLLDPHVLRWKVAREARCDRQAVLRGADPLLLAQALLHAARPTRPGMPALGPDRFAILKLRVSLLLAFSERRPQRYSDDGQSAIPLALAVLVIAMLLPHQIGTQPLDSLHIGIERVFTTAWR